jgi:hypothetical protein
MDRRIFFLFFKLFLKPLLESKSEERAPGLPSRQQTSSSGKMGSSGKEKVRPFPGYDWSICCCGFELLRLDMCLCRFDVMEACHADGQLAGSPRTRRNGRLR